ncbi:MAG: type II secretion system F family protein, partial [Jatrophihabitans sp.]
MTAALALAVALVILTLPSAPALRSGALVRHGRLLGDPAPATAVRAGSGPPVTRAVQLAVAVVILVVVLWWGLLLGVASAAVLTTGALCARDLRRRRAAVRLHRELLTVVGVLTGELVAGAQPANALRAAAEVGVLTTPVFTAAAEAAGRGADASSVLIDADLVGVRPIGLAWRVVESTGVALAQVTERVANDLLAQDALRRAVAVALAGPRSSAALLCTLPLVGLALGVAMGARPFALLVGEPLGQALCCAGVLLDVAGVLWI